jgi:hypothetical protein
VLKAALERRRIEAAPARRQGARAAKDRGHRATEQRDDRGCETGLTSAQDFSPLFAAILLRGRTTPSRVAYRVKDGPI